jgi:hypothetical protein
VVVLPTVNLTYSLSGERLLFVIVLIKDFVWRVPIAAVGALRPAQHSPNDRDSAHMQPLETDVFLYNNREN